MLFLVRMYKVTLVATLFLAIFALPAYMISASLVDDGVEGWNPNDSHKSYGGLAEERFSMECDYLGIGGERVKVARELFDTLLVERQIVDSMRTAGNMTRIGAIESINKIDLAYYLRLRELISGKRNLGRIDRMIVKVRARNESREKLSAHND